MASWIDIFIYLFIFVIAPLTFYLKKSGKTFMEFVNGVIEFFKGLKY